jgi:hypothetical protein
MKGNIDGRTKEIGSFYDWIQMKGMFDCSKEKYIFYQEEKFQVIRKCNHIRMKVNIDGRTKETDPFYD